MRANCGGYYMNLVQLKIQNDGSLAKYIKIIRKFDGSLSLSEIKGRIESGDFMVGFDLDYYDVAEELQGVDRKKSFRDMIRELEMAGTQVTVYHNGELSSVKRLDDWMRNFDEIVQEVGDDIDRESE